jgi:hypothetical protein
MTTSLPGKMEVRRRGDAATRAIDHPRGIIREFRKESYTHSKESHHLSECCQLMSVCRCTTHLILPSRLLMSTDSDIWEGGFPCVHTSLPWTVRLKFNISRKLPIISEESVWDNIPQLSCDRLDFWWNTRIWTDYARKSESPDTAGVHQICIP